MTPDEEIREKALAMAHRVDDTDENNLRRAEKYAAFLRGETGSKEPPLPVGEGNQPDALHG